MRPIAFLIAIAMAGASAPALSVERKPFSPLGPSLPVPNAVRSGTSSSSSVGRNALPASVLDRPAEMRIHRPAVPRTDYVPRGRSLVLTGAYDKRVVCSQAVFADDCLSATREVGVSGLKVLRSK